MEQAWVLGEMHSPSEWRELERAIRAVVGSDAKLGARLRLRREGGWEGQLYTPDAEVARCWWEHAASISE